MKNSSMKTKISRQSKSTAKGENNKWYLRLFVAGQTQKANLAFKNLKSICEEQLKGQYRIEVIDILKKPQLARDNQIVAIPTLIRNAPLPTRNIIGDLSNKDCVLVGLDLAEPNSLACM
jgi:circadian clock protein KaiB